MDELVVLVVVVLVAVVVLPIILLIGQSRTRRRLDDLEARVFHQSQRLLELTQQITGSEPDASVASETEPAPAAETLAPPKVEADNSKGPWEKTADRAAAAAPADPKRVKPIISQDTSPQPTPKRRSYVFSADRVASVLNWTQKNWFYVVAAMSLGLAGVFLVQYGIENGMLTPKLRVFAALGLGAALIAVGEYLRRKGADHKDNLFAYLPSTFAAGGLISMFSGVFSARALYDLIVAGPAMGLLATIGLVAEVIGWFYGPLLAAIGILGAIAAPFLVGGDPGVVAFLYYYFAVIVLISLLVDALKRWAWVSSFGLILGFAASAYLYAEAGEGLHLIAFAFISLLGAIIIPERSIAPAHSGVMLSEEIGLTTFFETRVAGIKGKPADATKLEATSFPTRVVAGVFLAATLAPLWVHHSEVTVFWLAFVALLALLGLSAIWMQRACIDRYGFTAADCIAGAVVSGIPELGANNAHLARCGLAIGRRARALDADDHSWRGTAGNSGFGLAKLAGRAISL